MDKPEYIKSTEEKTGRILSRVNVGIITTEYGEINETNYFLVYSDSIYIDNKIKWYDKILKTKHGFYLYLNRSKGEDEIVTVDIYYNPEQLNELTLFVKQFIKQYG